MIKHFNVDIKNIITDYKLSYQNTNDNFIEEFKKLNNNVLKIYTQKVEEHSRMLKQLSDISNKIGESREKLRSISNKVEFEQQNLQKENDRSETINNECRLLELEENNLKDIIHKTKDQVTQVFKEKKGQLKKLKREINAFKTGITMFEQFLQVSMDIDQKEIYAVINIHLKSVHQKNYKIVFEGNDNDYKLIDIIPLGQSGMKAISLYNQNKDIQGLLAFLYKTKD